MQPRQALLQKVLSFCRFKLRGLIERTNMEMRLHRPWEAFASQGRSTSGTKAAPRLAGRGVELGYLPFGNRISLQLIKREDRDRRAGMPSTTLTVTPIYRLGLSGRDKTDRAAQTAAFKLLGFATHDLILLGRHRVGSYQRKLSQRHGKLL